MLILGIAVALALGLAIAGFFFPLNNDGGNRFKPILEPSLLYVYDDSTQPINLVGGVGDWTSVNFNNDLVTAQGWTHSVGSSIFIAQTTGFHSVYFSIQVQVNNIVTSSVFACKACNMRYLLRATEQIKGVGEQLEIPGSRTYSNGQNSFLSKQFLISTLPGNIYRFQFNSLCNTTALYALPFVQVTDPAPIDNQYPASATLFIQ